MDVEGQVLRLPGVKNTKEHQGERHEDKRTIKKHRTAHFF